MIDRWSLYRQACVTLFINFDSSTAVAGVLTDLEKITVLIVRRV